MPRRELPPDVAKTVTRNRANQGKYLFISLADVVPLTFLIGDMKTGDKEALIVEAYEACGLTISERVRGDIRGRLNTVGVAS